MNPTLRPLLALLFCLSAVWAVETNLEPGVLYEVVNIRGKPVPSAEDLRTPTILIDAKDGNVSGCSGINRFGGSCVRSGTTVQFGQLFSSMMAASEPAMQVEQDFLAIISVPLQATMHNGAIVLTGTAGAITLKPAPVDSQK